MKKLDSNSLDKNTISSKMVYPKGSSDELYTEKVEMFPTSLATEFKNNKVMYDELEKNGKKMGIHLSDQERNILLNVFNKPDIEYPINKTIVDLFVEQVGKNPNEIAVVYKHQKLTFNELDIISNQLANYLISKHKIFIGDLIGIMLGRSEMLIVSILGVLKAGAAYVPIDPEYPEQRKNYIKNDSKCKFTMDLAALENFLINKETYSANPPSLIAIQPNDLAYIIYTSGSTGNPKGVMIEHCNLLNYLLSVSNYIDLNSNNSGCFAHLSLSFDASITEIFLPLMLGKKLILSSGTGIDVFNDINLFNYAPYDFIKLTPSHINILTSVINKETRPKLSNKYIIGGEALYNYHINLYKSIGIEAVIINEYGPTEATVGCCTYEFNTFAPPFSSESIPIGIPITNAKIYILDKNQQLLPIGEIGEICIAGKGIARGYLNREDLNLEKFCDNPFDIGTKMYRTGDLGQWLPDGNLIYSGRFDEQVKINGHRIELGEIEAALLTIPQIKQATVVLSNHMPSEPRLVAYLQSKEIGKKYPYIREELSKIVPSFMIPSFFMWLNEFPITTNGKIDKSNLPLPEYVRPDSAPLLRKPTTKTEKEIATVWSEMLQIPLIGIDDNFFEIGGTSLLTQRVSSYLKENHNLNVSVTHIYQYPTIATLCEFLEPTKKSTSFDNYTKSKQDRNQGDVAIIGMAGRFPGANTIAELWEVLKEGKETITFFKQEELDASISSSLRNDSLYVAARGIVPSANTFDAGFFGINPKLAEVMDPQIRLFLEIAWETLEQTGYLPKHYNGSIGVYAGTGTNTYYKKNILPNKEILDTVGYLHAETVNEKDYISCRTAYHLNLKGPTVSVHSGCSTSLLAIAQAVESIRNGHCDIALAGGSSVTAPIFSGHLYQEGSMLSPDGHCRSFDASGKGTVFSDGAGVVLLKSLDAAQKDGDKIYGLIKGFGITNDGGNKGSFTAPSTEGQAVAIMKALQDARVTPDSISYVETHGTATPLGDPIEIEGLKMAFGNNSKNGSCAIGSIKSNMGHLTTAAGVAGLIKTILAMNNKLIPPSLGFEKPNPVLDIENSPFFVNSKLSNWNAVGPLRAGVSSFGVGGTNVHLVVEEYPMEPKFSGTSRPLQVLMWSAKSENSLKGYETALGNFINQSKKLALADIAYSLNTTRDDFNNRSFFVAESTNEAAEKLISSKTSIKSSVIKVVPNEMGFLFPGQGAQFLQMGKTLYENEKVYRDSIDKCAELLMEDVGLDIRHVIYPEINSTDAEELLKDTRLTQPALFVTEYALSQLWMSWGVKPTFLCGHSIGEFVAAHLAGIMNLEDALHIVAIRGRLISELPGGSMLAVRVPIEKLKELLPNTLSVAAINSKQFCVVSGAKQDIAIFNKELDSLDIPNKVLVTSHAFHSYMMYPILDTFKYELEKIKLNIPRLPIISTVSGTWLTDKESTNPLYWVNHLKNTVRFADAMDTAFELDDFILLEVGPGQTLTTLARQQAAGKIIAVFPSLTSPKEENENQYATLLNTLGELWLRGINPNWNSFYKQQQRQKIDLPSYVFDRKPCWIDPINTVENIAVHKSIFVNTPIDSIKIESSINETKDSRKDSILSKISDIIKNTSGIIYESNSSSNTFLELGLDSLSLTQLSVRLKKQFNLTITFRQLNEGLTTPILLADYIVLNLPEAPPDATLNENEKVAIQSEESCTVTNDIQLSANQNQISLEQIVQQIQLLNQKIDNLQNSHNTSVNGSNSAPFQNTESLDSIQLNNDDQIKTNGIHKIEKSFTTIESSIQELFEPRTVEKKHTILPNDSPVQGAQLGRDENGHPAWFIEDAEHKGKFIKIKSLE